jgi:hypothetical protein
MVLPDLLEIALGEVGDLLRVLAAEERELDLDPDVEDVADIDPKLIQVNVLRDPALTDEEDVVEILGDERDRGRAWAWMSVDDHEDPRVAG